MAEFDSEIVRAKKRKIEEENFEGPLLSPPSQENLLPDSQLSGSQAVASDVFDLTLVEPVENERCDNEFVWEKIEQRNSDLPLYSIYRQSNYRQFLRKTVIQKFSNYRKDFR